MKALWALLLCLSVAAAQPRDYAPHSRLAAGKWARVGVTTDGVYRLDATFLGKISVTDVDLNRVRVYGGEAGPLPQRNDAPRADDLQELAVRRSADALLFYGQGPHRVAYRPDLSALRHTLHPFADTNYYYLWLDAPPGGPEIETKGRELDDVPTAGLEGFRNYAYAEDEALNLLGMGRLWFTREYDTKQPYRLTLPQNAAPTTGDTFKIRLRLALRSAVPKTVAVLEGADTVARLNFRQVSVACSYCRYADVQEVLFSLRRDTLPVLTLAPVEDAEAWLDYVSVEYQAEAKTDGSPLFVYADTANGGGAYFFTNKEAEQLRVWDLANPRAPAEMELSSVAPDEYALLLKTDTLRTFAAFTPEAIRTPAGGGLVTNQDLHGAPATDYLLITPPDFLPAAERLAAFHRAQFREANGKARRVQVATTAQIYHEFSGGKTDLTALRDCVKMFYDRAETPDDRVKYVLLLGDGGYKPHAARNFIPTYQARESLYSPEAYVSDDYLGFMGEHEGFWGERCAYFEFDVRIDRDTLDVAVGRLPVENLGEANQVIDKIIRYVTAPESQGDWRTKVLLMGDFKVTDNSFESNHMAEANSLDVQVVKPCAPEMTTSKIYLDNYPQVRTSAGERYPQAKPVMRRLLNEGQLLVNYTGHGAETNLSNYFMFEMSDLNGLQNGPRLPLWVTATCEYGRYDDPERRCGAELLVLHEAGAVGVMTAVRKVFSSANQLMNQQFYAQLFPCDTVRRIPTLGAAFLHAKNRAWSYPINTRCYSLLADPGIYLARPPLKVRAHAADTLRGLELTTVAGEILDGDTLAADFEGEVAFTLYDQPTAHKTLVAKFPYVDQTSVLFQGRAPVRGGRFTCTFTPPPALRSTPGRGKLTFYAWDGRRDASGHFDQFIVAAPQADAFSACGSAPALQVTLYDDPWRGDAYTPPHPTATLRLSDSLGIALTPPPGHELRAVIDEGAPIYLDTAFTADEGDYRQGTVRFILPDLAPGPHTLTCRAWNLCDLGGEARLTFIIDTTHRFFIDHIGVYPNPSDAGVHFYFEHNRPGERLDLTLKISDALGRRIRTQTLTWPATSSICRALTWDGFGEDGAHPAPGVYVYELTIQPQTGAAERRHGKLWRAGR